ncbi:hypothetical protein GFK26_08945 [Variovorax paradoxus]|uniref:Uncharacterized protein n=1 Tax=Variovorax paradoxus TaxID=34073 RepID=A0A5Q0M0X2_VARPD|nr:hypothetical protein [Variovorax paradoxus]QFZ82878.1 hypothetical protein GFK26_08945 [Variovorax paradoxus]
MTSSTSLANAWRLPRDFALITVAVEAAIVGVRFGRQLWSASEDSGYGLEVWLGMAANLAMAWVLSAALAWSHARQALEVRGAARLAQLRGPHVRLAGAYLIVRVLEYFVLSPWLYGLELLYMPGGRLVQLAMLVLGVWLATWIALRQGTQASAASSDAGDADAAAPPGAWSGRTTVALLIAAVFASTQVWCVMAVDPWNEVERTLNRVVPFLGFLGPPLLLFALAFWGGWLGIGRGPVPARLRPFRAVAASVLALVLVVASCAALFFVGLALVLVPSSSSMSGLGGLIVLVGVLVLFYLVLTVLLTRFITRRLYRPYL